MCLCGDVLYIQIKKWYVKFGATGSLRKKGRNHDLSDRAVVFFIHIKSYIHFPLDPISK